MEKTNYDAGKMMKRKDNKQKKLTGLYIMQAFRMSI